MTYSPVHIYGVRHNDLTYRYCKIMEFVVSWGIQCGNQVYIVTTIKNIKHAGRWKVMGLGRVGDTVSPQVGEVFW